MDMKVNGLIQLTKSYLDGRRAHVYWGRTLVEKIDERDPQESEFGPDLWRQAVNLLLREDLAVYRYSRMQTI